MTISASLSKQTHPARPAAVAFATAVPVVSTANRQAMPIIAKVVDQFRQVFGADQVRVAYAEEAGRKLGTPQPPGVKPVITGAGVPKRTPRKEDRP